MGFMLEIPYNQLLLLVMALFMFVGATRGWYREFITTCGLIALLAILIKPELAARIIDYISKLVRLILAFLQGRGAVDPKRLLAAYETVKVPFDGKNPYLLLIIALVGFVVLSYGTRGGGKDVSALSRILGGLLGLFNGYLAVSLFTEYVIKYIRGRTPVLATAAPPQQFSVAISRLPSGDLLRGQGLQILAGLLGVLAAVVFISNAMGRPIGKD